MIEPKQPPLKEGKTNKHGRNITTKIHKRPPKPKPTKKDK